MVANADRKRLDRVAVCLRQKTNWMDQQRVDGSGRFKFAKASVDGASVCGPGLGHLSYSLLSSDKQLNVQFS
jgi:hypothetical protein